MNLTGKALQMLRGRQLLPLIGNVYRSSMCCGNCKYFNLLNGVNPQLYTSVRGMRLWQEKTLRTMYWRKKRFDVEPEKNRPRSDWQDWNYQAELYSFGQRLHENNLSIEVLTRTFTHRSYVLKQQAKQEQLGIQDALLDLQDNQQLIVEGRQIIEDYCQKYLRHFLPKAPEECIQSLTNYLLSDPVMAEISKWIGCIDLVLCEEFPPNESTLADTVPALIGTIAQQSGIKRAHNFVIDFILTYLNGADLLEVWKIEQLDLNLNSYLKSKGLPSYEPRILWQSSTGTIEVCYVVGLYVNNELIGQSPGESQSIAKRMAELDAFRNLFGLTTSQVKFVYGPKAYDLDLSKCGQENFHLLQSIDETTVANSN